MAPKGPVIIQQNPEASAPEPKGVARYARLSRQLSKNLLGGQQGGTPATSAGDRLGTKLGSTPKRRLEASARREAQAQEQEIAQQEAEARKEVERLKAEVERAQAEAEAAISPETKKYRKAVKTFLAAAERGDNDACRTFGDQEAVMSAIDNRVAAAHVGGRNPIHGADAEGLTALHLAARNGDVDMLETLLDMQLDDEATDLKGRTPMHLAAAHGKTEALELLIDIGADVDIRCGKALSGQNALMLAAAQGHLEVIGVLLHTDVDLIDSKDSEGRTALDIALEHNQEEAATAIEAAAEARRVRSKKQKALDTAAKRGLLSRLSTKRTLRRDSTKRFDVGLALRGADTNERRSRLSMGFRKVSVAASVLARMSTGGRNRATPQVNAELPEVRRNKSDDGKARSSAWKRVSM